MPFRNPTLHNPLFSAQGIIRHYHETSDQPIAFFKERIKAFYGESKAMCDDDMVKLLEEPYFQSVPFLKDVLTLFLTQNNVDKLDVLVQHIQAEDDKRFIQSQKAYQNLSEKYGYASPLSPADTLQLFHQLASSCHAYIGFIEKGDVSIAFETAYKLMAIFDLQATTMPDAFEEISKKTQALLKSGKKTNKDQLLHDLILVQLTLPRASSLCDLNGWRTLIKNHNASALRYFSIAASIEEKLQRAPESLQEANKIKSELTYKNSHRDKAFAQLCLAYNVDEQTFDKCLAYIGEEWPKKKPADDKVPNEPITHQKYTWSKLPPHDKRALILGKITDCCQSIGGHSEYCVKDGVSLPNNGFYILQHKNKIIGQGYVWLSDTGNLCIDSIECLKNSIPDATLKEILTTFAEKILETHPEIQRVTLGKGGKTPKNVFGEKSFIAEQIKTGKAYSDSREQYCLAQRAIKSNDLRDVLKKKKYTPEFRQCIELLSTKVVDRENFESLVIRLLRRSPTFHARLTKKTFGCLMQSAIYCEELKDFAALLCTESSDQVVLLHMLQKCPAEERLSILRMCINNGIQLDDTAFTHISSLIPEADYIKFLTFCVSKRSYSIPLQSIYDNLKEEAKTEFWESPVLVTKFLGDSPNGIDLLFQHSSQEILKTVLKDYHILYVILNSMDLLEALLVRFSKDNLLVPFLRNNHPTLMHWIHTTKHLAIVKKYYTPAEIKETLFVQDDSGDTPLLVQALVSGNDILFQTLDCCDARDELYQLISICNTHKNHLVNLKARKRDFISFIEYCLKRGISSTELCNLLYQRSLLDDGETGWDRLKETDIDAFHQVASLLNKKEKPVMEAKLSRVTPISMFKIRAKIRPKTQSPLQLLVLSEVYEYSSIRFNALLDALVDIENLTFANNPFKFSKNTFRQELSQNDRGLAVLWAGNNLDTIYGYCLYEPTENGIYISSLCVDPDYSGNDYGYQLLKTAIDAFAKKTAPHDFTISLHCDIPSYYAKLGFESTQEIDSHIPMETSYTRFTTKYQERLERNQTMAYETPRPLVTNPMPSIYACISG